MKKGAYDYVPKPFNPGELQITVRKALDEKNLRVENIELKKELKDKYHYENIIGTSGAMQKIYRLIEKAAESNSSVVIYGESGTGKELIARAIHFNSARAHEKFVPVSCGAIPETLLESELFGYVKGAFTGANTDKKGMFEVADKGTLFLDEIGDIISNTRPPCGTRAMLMSGDSKSRLPSERVSSASSLPYVCASSGSQVAANAIGAGIAVAGGCGLAPPGPHSCGSIRHPEIGNAQPRHARHHPVPRGIVHAVKFADLFVQRHLGHDLPRPRHSLRMAHMSLLCRSRRRRPGSDERRNCDAD